MSVANTRLRVLLGIRLGCVLLLLAALLYPLTARATPFTMTVPGTSLVLPTDYPAAGGVAIVMVGANGNAYYQFSNPTGAFVGYNNAGAPAAFQGNPFTINNPINLNCGYSACSTYFGGSIAQVYIRFTASDGDTSAGNFDFNDITLRLNGFDVDNWSSVTTQTTNTAGTTAIGATHLGFGNNLFDTGWFSSTNPALLANILSTGRTTTQVYDRDPNDNYWDFSQGPVLANPQIVTVAPGYSLTKTPSTPTFTAVGQVVSYSYVVTNIGSVPIRNLSLSDNKIGTVTCNKTVILAVNTGQTPDSATCTANYTITQADFDAEKVTNIANAVGTPDYGTLGGLTATATVTGPTITPTLTLVKTSSLSAFGAVGSTVPYSFRVTNNGNATLTNVVVTDPRLPGLSCSFASMAPAAVQTCTANYTVTQADMDGFAAGTNLINTATVTARDPKNATLTRTSSVSLSGPAPVVTMFLDKTTVSTAYATVGQVLPYQILVRNTGNVTWPAAPTVTDSKTTVSCPTGTIAPAASITCTANYAVTQADLDAGSILNTANGTITVTGRTATATDSVTLNATRTTTFTLDKHLTAASPTSFSATGVALLYAYDLVNTGNVTLNTLAVTDNKTTVSCPTTTIAPGATVTCTASYTTTQADLNAGGVTNTASATTKAAGTGANVASNSDNVTVPAVQQPALSMTKTAPVLTALQFTVGRVVTYSYTVTNSGNVDLIAANQLTITDNKIGTFNCGTGIFLRGATRTCTATYTLTTADVLAGVVSNTASSKSGSTTSNQVTATIAPTLSPGLTLAKTASPASVAATSDVISYTFTVTNSGNTQIIKTAQPISIADPMLATVSCAAQPAVLNPGDSFACTASYNPTQAQLDAGQVRNTATASFPYNASTTITSPSSTATVPVVETRGLVLDKTGPANFNAVGQVLSYGFAVRNTGNTTLTTTTVTDPKIPGLACTLTNIAPGATKSCTGSYTVTQADMDAGVINNTATAQGATAAGGSTTGSDSVTVPVNPAVVLKAATFSKLANRTTFTAVGDSIIYTMRIANTGAQTLRNITVTDVLDAGYSCTLPVLLPGAVNTSCTLTHVVTQAEFDAGQVVNTASAINPDGTLTSSRTVTGPARTSSFTLVKTASGPYTAAGDVVTFGFTVRNTGNTTLSNLTVSDPFFTPTLSCPIASLAPGATNTSCTASYTVTQTDVDRGQITNTASASGSAPAGVTAPPTQTSTVVVAGPTRAPAVQITKTPSPAAFTAVGSTITYTFSVTNTGNVSLGGLTVADTALGFSCNLDNLAPGAIATTCAGGAPALSASRVMTQADVDRGNYVNTARVTGQSLIAGTAVTDTDTVTVLGPAQAPTIALAKDSTLVGPYDHVGQVVPYNYTITNTGNITLTGAFSVSDNKIAAVSCPSVPAAGVAPGGTLTCTGSYTITQADLNAGQVVNLATAQVVQSVVAQNPGDPTSVTVTSAQASETVTASQLPELTINKRVKAGSAASYAAVGDVVTFEYVVTNAGNVTTTAAITVSDDKIAGTLSCGAAGLAPGASVTCEQNWTATQAAIDAGEVTNTAFARTVYNATNVDSPSDSVTITAVQTASLAVVKTFTGTDAPGLFNVGDTLSYTIVVTNNGNVTVTGPITLDDSLTTPVCPTLPGNALAPGGTLNCTATHVVTANDIDLGAATNVVSATGSFGGNPVVSPSDNAIYPVDASPALSLTKTAVAGDIPFAQVGDTITYRYAIDNTGNVSLNRAIYITDDKLGGGPRLCKPAGVFTTSAPPVTCDLVYTVTQDDVDAGQVTNNATASTTYGPIATATNVVSPNASETVLAIEDPELSVAKTVSAGPNPASVDDVLTYRITTTNSGNQRISGVAVTDAKLGALSCTVGGAAAPANVVLAPAEALICTADYTVKQSDIDAQVLPNTATAQGVDPQGATISASGSITHPLQAANPSVEVTKVVEPAPGPDEAFSAVGQPVTFRVTVRNTGNITLNSGTVTDDLVSGSCAVPLLAPGASDSSCTFVVTATQADIDALYGPVGGQQYGGITNTVSVTAQPATPGSTAITDTGTAFAKGPDHQLALSLVKSTSATSFSAYGQVIPYTFVVANAGNVTLTAPVQITDALLGAPFTCGSFPPGGLPPREFVTCTRNYTVTQADVDAGTLTNTARVASTEVPYPSDPALQTPVTSSVTLTGSRNPALSVEKSADILSNAKLGDVIHYSYVVTNTGNVTLTALTPDDQQTTAAGTAALALAGDALVSDTGETGNTTDATANGIWDQLGPGDVISFTASYTVTQPDVDAGTALSNIVTVTAQSPSGTTAPTGTDSLSIPVIAAAPQLLVIKTADTSALASPPAVGNLVSYSITARNTGNVTLTAPVLTDTLSMGTAPGGAVILPAPVASYASGDANNNGALDVAEVWTYSASFALTQAAIDAGGISNTVTAATRDPHDTAVSDVSDNDGSGASDPTTTTLTRAPKLALVKTATLQDGGDGRADAGDSIAYTYTATNTGNVTAFDLSIVETGFSGTGTTPVPLRTAGGAALGGAAGLNDLAVGGTITYQVSYSLTQADIDAGRVLNQATVTGTDPAGTTVSDLSGADAASNAVTNTPLTAAAALDVQKRADISGLSAPIAVGDVIAYTITAQNTGNVSLATVAITDTLTDANGVTRALSTEPTYSSGDTDNDSTLDVGETWTYLAAFQLTQAAIDAGGVSNTATVSAKTPQGADVSDISDDDGTGTSDPTVTPLAATPGLEALKILDASGLSTPPVAGNVIGYAISVRNTGNVTLDGIGFVDTLTNAAGSTLALTSGPTYVAGDSGADGLLGVGEGWSYTASYTITQADIDSGRVSNTITFNATTPDDSAISDVSDNGGTGSSDPTVRVLTRTPKLVALKSAVLDLGSDGVATVGDVIHYSYSLQNTGNVTVYDVMLAETGFTGNGTTPVPAYGGGGALLGGVAGIPDLAVGATATYTADYALTQADIDAGRVINSATGSGTAPNGATVSDVTGSAASNDTPTQVDLGRVPALKVVKTADLSGLSDPVAAGDVVGFTVTVANAGNVSLSSVSLSDDFSRRDGTVLALTPAYSSGDAGAAGVLEVAEVWTYTASYTLTQADIDAGGLRNSATGSATAPGGAGVSDVSDNGNDSDGNTVDDPTRVNTPARAGVEITKALAADSTAPYDHVGQVLNYELTLRNSGNVTLTAAAVVSDALVNGTPGQVQCPSGPIAPAASVLCTAFYSVTQADLDRGTITNTADVTLTQPVVALNPGDPTSVTLTDTSNTVIATASRLPELALAKTVAPGSASSFDAVGDQVTFRYTLSNLGNVSLSGPFTVTDDKIAGTLACGAGPLAPGAQISCTQVWTATQADLDAAAGGVTNTAVAQGSFNGAPVTSPSDQVTVLAVQNPELALSKTIRSATPNSFDVGTVLAYDLVIRNSGNTTITAPISITDSLTSVNCPAPPVGGLVPGASLACTASYTLTATDIQLGSTTNTATASGTFAGTVVTSPTASATYPVGADPVLTLTKDSAPSDATFAAVGDVIHYAYSITNSGLVGLSGDLTLTDNRLPAPFVCRPASAGVFAVGAVANCSADYTVTQADLDAGFVTNEALATTIFAPDTPNARSVTSNPATKTVTATAEPALSVVKSVTAGPAVATIGDDLSYLVQVTNTGNQTLSAVNVDDPRLPGLACTLAGNPVAQPITLAPGDTLDCTGTYSVTQADIDAQSLINTAHATGVAPGGSTVTAQGQHDHPLVAANPAMQLIKTLQPDPGAASAYTSVGQVLHFRATLTNTGNVTLASGTITDTLVAGSCAVPSLAPGASAPACSFDYTVTQADLDRIQIAAPAQSGLVNRVDATAQPTNPGATPITATDDLTVLGPLHQPALTLAKSADVASASAFDDQITYSYLVTNSGNITLHAQPVVSDDKIASVSCPALPPTGLAPGAAITCTAPYSVTQADVDAGEVTNNASAISTEVATPATASLTLPITAAPGLSVVKTPSVTAGVQAGDMIDYTYTVTNTGNVSLTAVALDDQHTSAAGTAALAIAGDNLTTDAGEIGNSTDASANGVWDNLGPGDVASFTARYTVTQADIDAGDALTNIVSVNATTPTGPLPDPVTASASVTPAPATPAIEAVKLVDLAGASSPPVAGDVLPFTITLANTGNVTLSQPRLTDSLRRLDATPLSLTSGPTYVSGDAGAAGVLEVGEVWTYAASYTLTQADVDAGGISNQVVMTAVTPGGATLRDLSDDDIAPGGDDPTRVLIPRTPALLAEKTITAGPTTVGGVVEFLITASNTGNVSLSDVAVTSDRLTRADGTVLTLDAGPSFDGASMGSGAGQLLPGEVARYVASYTLTQADIDAGGIANSATVSGSSASGVISDVSDNGDDSDGNSVDDPTRLPITGTASLALTKRLAAGAAPSYAAAGDVIPFEFAVRNTGTLTLPAPVTVADPLIAAVTCPTGELAPAAQMVCTGSYTVTQADVDAGQITNTATASAGTATSAPATRIVPAQQTRGLSVVKTASPLSAAQFVVGAQVNYTYTVTNSGNVTLTAPISISDNRIAAANLSCPTLPVGGLLPAAQLVCSGSYTVTADDVDLGSVTNLASATDGTTTSPLATETVPDNSTPALALVKTATSGADFAAVGDVIAYSYAVTNSGSRAFVAPVSVMDDKLGEIACFTPSAADPDLRPAETVTCTANHTVTQADLDAGQVVNQAYGRTTYGSGAVEVVSAPDTVTVQAAQSPTLALVKTASPAIVSAVGQVVHYDLTAQNSGNQTLRSVEISDPMFPGLTCQVAVLLPGDSLPCSADYTVTQADIDRGGPLLNTATATAVSPRGTAVADVASASVTLPVAAPALTLEKTALPTPFGVAGTRLTYVFTVTNAGNVSLSNAVVTDPMDAGFSCTIATLAPGARSTACRMEVVITQAQVDAGSITNTASVTATATDGSTPTATDTVTTAGPARLPGLKATKTTLTSGTGLGAVVRYQLTLRNTGNVSLTPAAPIDSMTRLDASPTALDAPFALVSGDNGNGVLDLTEVWIYQANHVITQADIDAGGLSNQVSASASVTGGGTVSDLSDDGDDSDGNTTDDPTLFPIVPGPALHVTKVISALTGQGVGDSVTFTITALNTGSVTLNNLGLTDTLSRADGSVLPTDPLTGGASSLAPGASADWHMVHVLTQADIDAGGLENTATVAGQDPTGAGVSDVSDNGDNSDGNTTDDPTRLTITPTTGLVVLKVLDSIGAAAGEDAVFTVTARNNGSVTLNGVSATDTLSRLDGSSIGAQSLQFVSNSAGSPAGVLAAGETATWSLRYTLAQADLDAGGLSNTATVAGNSPLGVAVSDISDDDGQGDSDPTLAPLTTVASLSVVKSASEPRLLFQTVQEVTFTLAVTNTGNVTQTDISLRDDLAAFLAPAVLDPDYSVTLTATGFAAGGANPAYDGAAVTETLTGAALNPGQTGTVAITLVYSTVAGGPGSENIGLATSAQHPTEEPSNPVALVQTDSDGDGITDIDEGPGDRDGDGIANAQDYDPTGVFYCEDTGQLQTGGRIRVTGPSGSQTGVGSSNGITIVRDGSDGSYQFFVTHAGSYRLELTYPSGTQPSTTRLDGGTLDLSSLLPARIASIGSGPDGSSGHLVDFSAGANRFFLTFTVASGDPHLINNNIPLIGCNGDSGGVVATKTADRGTAVYGETVNFTLTYDNATLASFIGASFIDQLPEGLVYTPGSASLDGVAIEPEVQGRQLRFGPLDVAAQQKRVLRLAARVSTTTAAGKLVNQSYMLDANGAQVSNTATATVRIQPEAVFECSDVIGKVFDDRNHNGIQDGPGNLPPLSEDDSFTGGKYGKFSPPKPLPKGYEPGLPGVRLATVNGLLITTDAFGRYHVPCAALPKSNGSNFTLKLDTRTLPLGYQVTTENPRVLRLTPGKVAKMNFGVAASKLVDITLTAKAFDGDQPKDSLRRAITKLLAGIQDTPTALRLAYLLGAEESTDQGNARLKAAEAAIRKAWRGVGGYDLAISREVRRK